MRSEPEPPAASSPVGRPDPSEQPVRGALARVLVGYFLAYAAFEGTAQLAADPTTGVPHRSALVRAVD